ncbi:MAG: YbjQ family protein [Chloroflexota bacterium]|nr:YbjQ family protein [Chloroflexota bacterium]
MAMTLDHSLVTTGNDLAGFRVARHFGVVRGIVVRSRSIVGNIGAAFQQLAGGNITLYTNLCEQARGEAYELMIQHAQQMGANALIGVRYDATEISQGVSEVLCYGTAVYVVPLQ